MEQMNFINRFLQKRRWQWLPADPGTFLDIGCRYGELHSMYRNGFGVDVEGTVGNKLEFPDSSFDIVTMFAVVEHIDPTDMMNLQREIERVLNENGVLILTSPLHLAHPMLKFLAFLNIVPKKDIDEHCIYYNESTILNVFERFQLVSYKRFDLVNQVFVLCKK
jgi:SAM-dependent methyltransferase